MLVANERLNELNFSLAQYYLGKLRRLEALYHQGHEHSYEALREFDREWPQMKRWHDWLAAQLFAAENARLLVAFAEAGTELLRLRQHPRERLEWLELGLQAAQDIGNRYGEMLHLHLLARLHNSLTNVQLAQEYAERALQLAEKLKNTLYQSRILATLSNTFYKASAYEQAHTYAQKALELAQSLDAVQEIGAALNALANTELSQSEYRSAYEHYLKSLEIAEIIGRPHDICLALHNLSNIAEIVGLPQEAMFYAERCIELSRQTNNYVQLTTSLGMLGFLLGEEGKLLEAQNYLQESIAVAIQFSLRDEELHALGRLGNLRVLLKDYAGALSAYQSALTLAQQMGFPHFLALSLGCLAQVERYTGNYQAVKSYLREGLEVIASLKMHSIQIIYLHEIAQLWYQLGYVEEAAQYLGILEDNLEEFDNIELQNFTTLSAKIATSMGETAFVAAKNKGKTLKLDSLLQDIYAKLTAS